MTAEPDPLEGKVWAVDLHDDANAEGDEHLPVANAYGVPADDHMRGDLPESIPDVPEGEAV